MKLKDDEMFGRLEKRKSLSWSETPTDLSIWVKFDRSGCLKLITVGSFSIYCCFIMAEYRFLSWLPIRLYRFKNDFIWELLLHTYLLASSSQV